MEIQSRWFKPGLILALTLGGGVIRGQQADEPPEARAAEPAIEKAAETEIESNQATNELENEKGFGVRIHHRRTPEIVKFGGETVIREGEESSDIVVVFGSARIDGIVNGDAVVIGGRAKVNGNVRGNLVVPMGSAELGPNAHIEENAVIIGGVLNANPEARVDGDRFELSWEVIEAKVPLVAGAKNWVMHGLILGRPLPHQLGWWWWYALACAAMYLLTLLVFPRPITASVSTLESQPIGSFFMGVLVFILFVPLLLLLIATGIGIVVVPFLFCAALVAFLFGKVAVYSFAGQQIGKQVGVSMLQLPILALPIGIVIFYLVYMIPVLGFLVWGIVAPLGLGASILAASRAFRSEAKAGNSNPHRTATNPATENLALGSTAASPPFIEATAASAIPAGDVSLLPRAGFWIRFAATFLDLLLIGAFLSVTHLHLLFLIVWVAYHVGMWTWKGTTIGGVVFGIKVIRKDGRPLDFAVALVRSLASFLSALVLFLGFFWAGWTREKQSWHDLIAGTVIVRMPKGVPML